MSAGNRVIFLSFVVALMLTMLPLPQWAEYARPEWVTMVLIYWCMALPDRVGIGIGWLLGLFLDVIHGTLLGQYAIALALVAYFTIYLHKRIRIFPVWQQALVVMMFTLLQLLVVVWIKGIIGQSPDSALHWLPALSTMLLWPWLYLILRDLRRRYRLS